MAVSVIFIFGCPPFFLPISLFYLSPAATSGDGSVSSLPINQLTSFIGKSLSSSTFPAISSGIAISGDIFPFS